MKYVIIAAIIGISAGSVTAGVFYFKAAEYHDVAWYRANLDAMKVQMDICANNAGLAAGDPNCRNAAEAQTTKSYDDFIAKAAALPWH
jgi:hypothetical protein